MHIKLIKLLNLKNMKKLKQLYNKKKILNFIFAFFLKNKIFKKFINYHSKSIFN